LHALEEILSSILEVSRLEAGIIEVKRRACTSSEVIAPLIAEYRPRAAAKRLRLESSVPELALHTDPELVRRVLRNLLDNAIKFTDAGAVRIDAHRNGDALVLAVSDTGRGIAKSQQAQVFEDYYQGENPQRDRRQGLGLGLAIVRRLVGLLGGAISLKSDPGRGTRFELRLPAAIDTQHRVGEERREAAAEPGMLRGSRVLVVEDDRLVIEAMSTLFSSFGVEARFAIDADDALMETALGRFIPEVALVDFGLPGELDGISLVRELRVRLPRCVFLLVTGDTRPEVIRRAADAGIPTLHKPVTVERLNEKLKELGVAG
jgi:two-component system CheB/CheR fusion protein